MWHQWFNRNIMKLWEYFLSTKKTKTTIVSSFTCQSLTCSWEHHDWWTTDVTWTILTMSLLPFWALNVSVALPSMQSQKALGFHQNILIYVLKRSWRSYKFGTRRELAITDRIVIFGQTIPLIHPCCIEVPFFLIHTGLKLLYSSVIQTACSPELLMQKCGIHYMQTALNSECAIVMLVNKAECMNSFTPGTQIYQAIWLQEVCAKHRPKHLANFFPT